MLQVVVCKLWCRTGSQAAYSSAGEVEGRPATQAVSTAGDSVSAQVDAADGGIAPCASDVMAEAIRHAVLCVADPRALLRKCTRCSREKAYNEVMFSGRAMPSWRGATCRRRRRHPVLQKRARWRQQLLSKQIRSC